LHVAWGNVASNRVVVGSAAKDGLWTKKPFVTIKVKQKRQKYRDPEKKMNSARGPQ